MSILVMHDSDCRRSSICFTETWLTEQTTNVGLDGYITIRFDRNKGNMIVINKCATNLCVRERISTPPYEILTVSFRPHYLPHELGQVTVILVHIPGPDYTGAAERVAECYNRTINRSIDQAVFVLGDFNSSDTTSLLPDLYQSVTYPTHRNKMIDLCYSNIPDAFQALCRPGTTTSRTHRGDALVVLIGRCFMMAALIMLITLLSHPRFSFANKP